MKTHNLANALSALARILRSGPNVELSELDLSQKNNALTPSQADKGAALVFLVGIASYSKSEWISVIKELGLPVEVKTTDSTRDLMGRLFKYLGAHPEVRDRLMSEAHKTKSRVSPELMKALSILLDSNV